MTEPTLPDEIMKLFTQLIRRYSTDFRQQLETNCTGPQLYLLEILCDEGSQKMSDLAEKMRVTVGAVTLLADRLFKSEYVIRERTDKDRRVVMLSITDTGREMVVQHRVVRQRLLQTYFGQLSSEDLQHLSRIYRKMLGEK